MHEGEAQVESRDQTGERRLSYVQTSELQNRKNAKSKDNNRM